MTWMHKLGRTLYAVCPFLLVGALILAGVYSANFTTEQVWSPSFDRYESVVAIHPGETYIHNVTISYEVIPPITIGPRLENGSLVIEIYPLDNTITSWTRAWLPFYLELNESRDAIINQSLVGPDGIIDSWAEMSLAAAGGTGISRPEATRGGTFRLSLQNMGPEDIHPKLSWQVEWHFYEKPYLYYGIMVLVVALVLTVIFLVRKFGPWKSRQQKDEEMEISRPA